jgi:hypothetical protein
MSSIGCHFEDDSYISVDATKFVSASALGGTGLFHAFQDESSLLDYIMQSGYSNDPNIRPIHTGIIFEWNAVDVAAGRIGYRLRMNSTDVPFFAYSVEDLQNAYAPSAYHSSLFYQYLQSHTLLVQYLVGSFLINFANTATGGAHADLTGVLPLTPTLTLEPFPLPAQQRDDFAVYFDVIIGLFCLLAFLYPISRFVRDIVHDRETKITETGRVMGAHRSASVIAWTIVYAIQLTVSAAVCTAVLHINVLKHANPYLIFVLLTLFAYSLLALGCAISAMFSRARLAGLVSPLVLFLLWCPFFAVYGDNHPEDPKNSSCLLSPTCFALGAFNIIHLDGVNPGAQWSDLNVLFYNFRLQTLLVMLCVDTLIYVVLAWYLDSVWPTEHGSQWPVYFIFLPSYWRDACGCTKRSVPQSRGASLSGEVAGRSDRDEPLLMTSGKENVIEGPSFQALPASAEAQLAIRIRHLRKIYPASLVGSALHRVGVRCIAEEAVCAVESVDLDVCRGEIMVLLGENGAGDDTRHASLWSRMLMHETVYLYPQAKRARWQC